MTTIAYKDGVFAYDTRKTAGPTIIDDDFDKRFDSDGATFFMSGSCADMSRLIDLYFGREVEGSVGASALVIAGGLLWLAAWDEEDGFWKAPLDPAKPYAIGSGQGHAWTAMDMGATAYQAVEMAMKRDTSTGGKVKTFTI